jgi:hypothetical protein
LRALVSKPACMQPPLSYVTHDLPPGVTLAQWARSQRAKRARARRVVRLPRWTRARRSPV